MCNIFFQPFFVILQADAIKAIAGDVDEENPVIDHDPAFKDQFVYFGAKKYKSKRRHLSKREDPYHKFWTSGELNSADPQQGGRYVKPSTNSDTVSQRQALNSLIVRLISILIDSEVKLMFWSSFFEKWRFEWGRDVEHCCPINSFLGVMMRSLAAMNSTWSIIHCSLTCQDEERDREKLSFQKQRAV